MAKLLRIPIERFRSNRAIIESVFLEFPRNKKNILVLHHGDCLEEGYLEKLKGKGVKYLCFSVNESDSRDPNTCEIFLESNTIKNSQETTAEIVSENTSSAEVSSQITAIDDLHSQQSVDSSSSEEPLDKTTGEVAPEEVSTFSADSKISEEVTSFGPNKMDKEEEQIFSAGALDESHAENRFSADRIQKDSTELRFSKSPEEEETRTIRASPAKKEDEEEFRFNQSPTEEKLNEIADQSKNPMSDIDPFIKVRAKSLSHLKDLLIEGQTVDFLASRDALLKDFKSKMFASKLEKRIIENLEQISDPDTVNEQLRDLELKLKKIRNGYIDEEVEAEYSGAAEIGQFEKLIDTSPVPVPDLMTTLQLVEETTQTTNKSLEEAYAVVNAKKSNANQNSRDAAASLSKLAAYLGSAIGYSNVDFLAELGFGVVFQYQQRMGVESSTEKLPPFSRRALMDSYSPNSLVDDYLNVLKFIELYSSDPLVDLKDKEFSKKIFDRTLEKTKNAEFSPDPMSLSQWVTFVEKGPSMDVHSICSKASAKALKYVKDAAN